MNFARLSRPSTSTRPSSDDTRPALRWSYVSARSGLTQVASPLPVTTSTTARSTPGASHPGPGTVVRRRHAVPSSLGSDVGHVPTQPRRRDLGLRLPADYRPRLPVNLRLLHRRPRLAASRPRRRDAASDRCLGRPATARGDAVRHEAAVLIRDNDGTFGPAFARVAARSRSEVLLTPIRAPRVNAVCERLLGNVRRVCF